MNCSEVNRLLSAYFDNELPVGVRSAISEHLTLCDLCTADLAGFDQLSAIAERLETPTAPAAIWNRIEESLDSQSEHVRPRKGTGLLWKGIRDVFQAPQLRWSLATFAVLFVLAAGIGYLLRSDHQEEHHEMAAVFRGYLEEFSHDPLAAQQFLLESYESQAVDTESAGAMLGYRPAVAVGMPPGYEVESMHVMEMPCCKCVQCLCQRADGTRLVVFEHDEEQMSEWFGERSRISTVCNGMPCTVIQLGDRIAANWSHGSRQITVIGLRDTEELGHLVAWFDDRRRKELSPS